MNIKRISNIAISFCLIGSILTGCGNVQKANTPDRNIIEDNYRNYYEIFVGSFYDSNGDGIGDINGITEKLDYIAELGCNGIWLTPIMAAPSYHKYDTTDYYMVDPDFGTNEDFERLTRIAHEKGIRVVIDLVINHSSSEHPWFTEACDYLRTLPSGEEPDKSICPYVEYYNFSREPKDNTYKEVSDSDWYYEAVFDYSQPDLNLHNEELVNELYRIADFWIDLGVDGFRMDAAMHYDDKDQNYNIDFLGQYYKHCIERNPDFYMVSEVWASESVIADYYASGIPSLFNFDAADAEGKLIKAGRGTISSRKFASAMETYQLTFSDANPDYIDAPFITNHDMGRVANALQSDPESLKFTAGLLLSMNGSPFIYYGEEIGMKSKGKLDQNKRLHMNWGDASEGICTDPEGSDADIVQTFPCVEEQLTDSESILSYYKRALSIRNGYPEIARGKITLLDEISNENVAGIKKDWSGQSIYIFYNNTLEEQGIDVTGFRTESSVLEIVGDLEVGQSAASLENETLILPARSIVYLK